MKALYVPQNTEVCVERVYYFCVDLRCISHKPIGSNLSTPPSSVEVDGSSVIQADVEKALAAAITIF